MFKVVLNFASRLIYVCGRIVFVVGFMVVVVCDLGIGV